MIGFLRATLLATSLAITTALFGGWVIVAAIFRMKDRPGSPYDLSPHFWGKVNLWVAGVKVVEHNPERKLGSRHVFVCNHLGNFDVLALASKLRWMKFVAKAELFRIPLFGKAMLSAGMVPIERANRKAAFGSYSIATQRIQSGASVAVYPEGTRGYAYPLRPFKKGPFVLAIQAQAPIIPMLAYGQLEIQPKGKFHVTPRTIHLHYLPAIETTGMTYDDRDRLARLTYEAIAQCLEREYGVVSPPYRGA